MGYNHQTTSSSSPDFLTTHEAMALTRHTNPVSFRTFVRRTPDFPRVRVNCRRYLYPRAGVLAWLKRRSVGRQQ